GFTVSPITHGRGSDARGPRLFQLRITRLDDSRGKAVTSRASNGYCAVHAETRNRRAPVTTLSCFPSVQSRRNGGCSGADAPLGSARRHTSASGGQSRRKLLCSPQRQRGGQHRDGWAEAPTADA